MKMRLDFANQKMLLASVNVRSEQHGESREPAGDVGLKADLPNDVLAVFHPRLKALLYTFDEARPQDLADQGRAKEKGYLPHLLMPDLNEGSPIGWSGEVENVRVTIAKPGMRKRVVLEPAKINKFTFLPRDGGTVTLAMRVQAHPDSEAFGDLAAEMVVQTEVEVTVEALPEKQQEIGHGG